MNKFESKKVITVVFDVLVILLTAFVVLVLVWSINMKKNSCVSFFGHNVVKLETANLEPEYNTDDVVFVKNVDSLKSGDVAVLADENDSSNKYEITIYKVSEVNEESGEYTLVTQNPLVPVVKRVVSVNDKAILGLAVRKNGALPVLFDAFASPLSFMFCIVIPSLFAVFYELTRIVFFLSVKKKS